MRIKGYQSSLYRENSKNCAISKENWKENIKNFTKKKLNNKENLKKKELKSKIFMNITRNSWNLREITYLCLNKKLCNRKMKVKEKLKNKKQESNKKNRKFKWHRIVYKNKNKNIKNSRINSWINLKWEIKSLQIKKLGFTNCKLN